ncbi:hypothetical protein ADUPG1_010953 [Aduncisulcus paluster]|uniref:Uncharacterized protein n=1 Tax=Aduncisulcus paluster TaxID=2918883 RepID=A0ABQ5JTI5_9EUKA|nr:hypothetical protein ADUPG1_010953 [Aduncisulcus paluster]
MGFSPKDIFGYVKDFTNSWSDKNPKNRLDKLKRFYDREVCFLFSFLGENTITHQNKGFGALKEYIEPKEKNGISLMFVNFIASQLPKGSEGKVKDICLSRGVNGQIYFNTTNRSTLDVQIQMNRGYHYVNIKGICAVKEAKFLYFRSLILKMVSGSKLFVANEITQFSHLPNSIRLRELTLSDIDFIKRVCGHPKYSGQIKSFGQCAHGAITQDFKIDGVKYEKPERSHRGKDRRGSKGGLFGGSSSDSSPFGGSFF